jgi:hypothetical protein
VQARLAVDVEEAEHDRPIMRWQGVGEPILAEGAPFNNTQPPDSITGSMSAR